MDLAPVPGRVDRDVLLSAGSVEQRGLLLAYLAERCSEICDRAVPADPDEPVYLDSIAATELKLHIEYELGAQLPLTEFGDAPTLGRLADTIAETMTTERTGPEPAEPASGPAARLEQFGLTDVQHAYWLGRSGLFELGDVSTHVYLAFESADFDLERASWVLRRLVDRHDMLRAVIRRNGRQQVLSQPGDIGIGWEDLSAWAPEEAAERVAAVRDELSHEVRPADAWPLFEVRAQRLPNGLTCVHLSLDLLVADAGSVGILLRDWAEFYREPHREPPPLGISFREYAQALTAFEQGEEFERARRYWSDRVADLPPAPELPVTATHSALPTRFVRRSFTLDPARWKRLKDLSVGLGVTPSAVLATAYADVLALWAKNPHFTLNLTTGDRRPVHPDIGRVVGDFTSLVLLEVDAGRAMSFAERVRVVQSRLWNDLEHRAFSGVRVLRELARAHGAARAAMPIVFTSLVGRPFGGDDGVVPGLGRLAGGISQTPQVHLDHQVYEYAGGLVVNWDAVDALFPPGVLDDAFATYGSLLERLAEEPGSWEKERVVGPPSSDRRLQDQANATAGPVPDGLLHEAVARAAESAPGRIAVVTSAIRLSYAELIGRARRIGRRLRVLGARPNVVVAVSMDKGWEQVVAVLGILESGAAYVPIDPELPEERCAHLFDRTGATIVLTQRAVHRRLAWPSGVTALCVDDEELWAQSDDDLNDDRRAAVQRPTDLAYVIFTSGSTGRPKGVMVDHRGALNTVCDINRRFAVGRDDRVLAVSSLSFDLSVWDIFGVLAAGGTVVVPDPGTGRDPTHWLDLVRHEDVTVWNSVPALFELLIERLAQERQEVPALRLAMLSGDWIPVTLPDRAREHIEGLEVISLGGATEASIWSIFHPVGEVNAGWTSIPYGRPLTNQTFHVLDQGLEPRPIWVPGELYIGGIGLAQGYWRDPDKTAAQFIVHPRTGERLYRTGDLGRYLPDGSIEFLGREDFQVKIGGHRVELGEIEAALAAHDDVSTALVEARGEVRGSKRLVAYVVAEPGRTPDPRELRDFVGGKLPGYMVPAAICQLDVIPLTPNGKVDRRALPGPRPGAAPARVPPRGPAEQLLAGIWGRLLGVPGIGVHDDVFEFGADSLLALRAVGAADDAGLSLELRDVFECPTIADQALRMTPAVAAGLPIAAPDPEARLEPFGLTDVQHAYWLGRSGLFEFGDVSTHLYLEFESDDLDLGRAGLALRHLVERHDMLRAVVRGDGRQQIIERVAVPPLCVEDLTALGPEEAAARVEEVRAELSHEVRPADRWPLFLMWVQRLPGGTSLVHVSLDLLVADAGSIQVLLEEWTTLYERSDRELPPLGLSFRDYAIALAELEGGEAFEKARAYWRDRLADLPPAPELPLRENNHDGPTRFVRRRHLVGTARWERLKSRAAALDITPSALMCAAFAETLAAWSRSERFTLNVTVGDRLPLHADVDRLVGDFTSLILLEVDAGAGGSFADRARSLQRRLWEDLEHRAFSGVRVLRELARHRGPARAAMPIVFTSAVGRPIGGPEGSLPGLGRLLSGISQTPQVHLDHQAYEQADGLVVSWDAVEALFPDGMLDSAFSAYCHALERLSDEPESWSSARLVEPVGQPPISVRPPLPDCGLGQAGGRGKGTAGSRVAPRTPAEGALAAIWCQLIGIDEIGVHDDVFELGADSLLALRAVGFADNAGLRLELREVFDHPTVAEQAVRTTPVHAREEQGLVVGETGLTPAQSWFLNLDLSEPHHWNDASFLLSLRHPLDKAALEAALRRVIEHHDALRLRFNEGTGGWRATIAGPPESLPFSAHDLSGLDAGLQKAAVTRLSDRLQASLDLGRGPLLRVAYFDLGERPHCLLFLAHWLAVDHYSGRLLLTDVLDCYERITAGRDAALPLKTTAFPAWTTRLQDVAHSTGVLAELDYWTRPERSKADQVRVDHPGGVNDLASLVNITVRLGYDVTERLLREAPRLLGVEVTDLLGAALLRSLPLDEPRDGGTRRVLVDIERHGRDLALPGADVSRTVGRFSTLVPMLYEFDPAESGAATACAVARQDDLIPGNGAGHGLLRYLCTDPRARELRRMPTPQVGLNYVGQVDEVFLRSDLLSVPRMSYGRPRSTVGTRARVIDVLCYVVAGRLTVTLGFSTNLHSRRTRDEVTSTFVAELEHLSTGGTAE